MDHAEERIEDSENIRELRRKARVMVVLSIAGTLVITAIVLLG